jgi:hypothetical protein
MSSAMRRGMALPILCCLAGACSGNKADPRAAAKDPNVAAVVRGPAVVLPSDTMKPDTTRPPVVAITDAQRSIATNFAILGAAIAFGDRRMIAANYDANADVITPDTTYKGSVAIANGFANLGPAKSLRDFRRRSLVTKIVDSTVVDSGAYVILSKRSGADSLFERGRYATVWRIHAPPMNWLIVHDRLYREPSRKSKQPGR